MCHMSALSNTESQVPTSGCCKSVSSLPVPSMPVPHPTGTRLCHEPLLILALDVFSLPSPSMPGMHVAWTRVEHDDCSFWHLGSVYSCTCTDFACLCVECCIPLMHTSHSCVLLLMIPYAVGVVCGIQITSIVRMVNLASCYRLGSV